MRIVRRKNDALLRINEQELIGSFVSPKDERTENRFPLPTALIIELPQPGNRPWRDRNVYERPTSLFGAARPFKFHDDEEL